MSRPEPTHDDQLEAGSQAPNKRRRIALACVSCRARKSRCDGARPVCSLCAELGFDCVYRGAASSSNAIIGKEYLSDIERRLAQVEGALEIANDKIAGLTRSIAEPVHHSASNQASLSNDTLRHADDMGAEGDSVDGMGALTFEADEESAFFGPSSNIALLRHVSRALARSSTFPQAWTSPSDMNPNLAEGRYISISRPVSPVRPVHASNDFLRPHLNVHALPPDEETLSCIVCYFSDTGALYPYIHAESFIATYKQMRSQSTEKIRRTWLGLLNMILALATSAAVDPSLDAAERISRSDVFYQRAQALCEKQIMRGASLETVQLLLLMGQYLQGTQKSMQAWVMHGIAVKAAFALGLHDSDASPSFSPLEREVRKRTWFGCVVLDRTLSMTFGRPCGIPHSYIRQSMPSAYPPSAPLDELQDMPNESVVLSFYSATITLYEIMSRIIESLYSNNLTTQSCGDVNGIVSQLFHFEQELSQWESSLSPEIKLLTPAEISPSDLGIFELSETQKFVERRFRNVLTLRYLNLRLLLHRPILQKLIDASVDGHSSTRNLGLFQQMRQHSLSVCMESANSIISIVFVSIQSESRPRWNLIGAWWFSLYYTFNAALVITACLLAKEKTYPETITGGDQSVGSALESMHRAKTALKALDRGNYMVDRCCHYLEKLTQMVKGIVSEGSQAHVDSCDSGGGLHTTQISSPGPGQDLPLYSGFGNSTAFDIDLGQFVSESDFHLLNDHLGPGVDMHGP